jgi:hypothetical protein
VLRATLERALAESFVFSFRAVMLVAATLAVLSAVCAAITIRPARRPHPLLARRHILE